MRLHEFLGYNIKFKLDTAFGLMIGNQMTSEFTINFMTVEHLVGWGESLKTSDIGLRAYQTGAGTETIEILRGTEDVIDDYLDRHEITGEARLEVKTRYLDGVQSTLRFLRSLASIVVDQDTFFVPLTCGIELGDERKRLYTATITPSVNDIGAARFDELAARSRELVIAGLAGKDSVRLYEQFIVEMHDNYPYMANQAELVLDTINPLIDGVAKWRDAHRLWHNGFLKQTGRLVSWICKPEAAQSDPFRAISPKEVENYGVRTQD